MIGRPAHQPTACLSQWGVHPIGMPTASSRSLIAPQIEIQYLEFGPPDGIPVFLLHGFPDSPAAWYDVVRRFKSRPVRLLVPYLRGTGKTNIRLTDHMSGQPAALASDVLTLADMLKLDKFYLAGQDWGARTAYAVSVLAPHRVRGVLALATPYVAYRGKIEPVAQAQAYWYQWYFNTEHGAEAFASDPVAFCRCLWQLWSPRWRFSHREFAEAAVAFSNPQFVSTVLHSYRQRWKGAPSAPPYELTESILAAKPKIEVPTIFAYGTADACNLPESSEGQAPWFTGPFERVALKSVGHFPQREDPKSVTNLIEHLLRMTRSKG